MTRWIISAIKDLLLFSIKMVLTYCKIQSWLAHECIYLYILCLVNYMYYKLVVGCLKTSMGEHIPASRQTNKQTKSAANLSANSITECIEINC